MKDEASLRKSSECVSLKFLKQAFASQDRKRVWRPKTNDFDFYLYVFLVK